MPIYEYRCQECQQSFEEWQKDFSERQVPCPVCGGKAERLISSTSFVLKGGGWYSDLYSKPAESKAEPAAKEDKAPASETKPGAAPGAEPSGAPGASGNSCSSVIE